MDEETIRALVGRLARRDQSGGAVIERAAIVAAGADSAAVLAWIVAHDGEPEAVPASSGAAGGLHGGRLRSSGASGTAAPRRYVLPPGALSWEAPAGTPPGRGGTERALS